MPPPHLTPEQRARALEKAALARRRRAEVKQRLKSGSLSFSGLLDEADSDPLVAGIKATAVISSMPKMGKIKAKRLMERLEIKESRRIRGLGGRQRAALLEEFG